MNKYSRNQTANEAYAVMKTKKPFGKEDHKIVGNRAEAKRVANRENEKLEDEGKENDSPYIYRKVSEDNAEKYNLPKGAKEMVENNKEELYGLEALEVAGLDEFQSALSQAINERGALTVIETMMKQGVGSDFKDQLHFIKNTTDLSDTNLVLNEVMQSVETLLDDVQVEQMVEALKPNDFETDETEPELGEYVEPENWDEVDSIEEEPQGLEEETNQEEDGEAHEALEDVATEGSIVDRLIALGATESEDENELTKLKNRRQQVENDLDRKADQGVDYSSESKELDEIDAKIKELEGSDKKIANEAAPATEGSLVEKLKALAFEEVEGSGDMFTLEDSNGKVAFTSTDIKEIVEEWKRNPGFTLIRNGEEELDPFDVDNEYHLGISILSDEDNYYDGSVDEDEDYFDDDHADEWTERYPYGYYHSENDKGTGDEDLDGNED